MGHLKALFIFQDYCGPEKEVCVASHALDDMNCVVPCEGLYADITDDSLKQDLMKGDNLLVMPSLIYFKDSI